MNKAIIGGLVVVLLAASPASAATVTVGDHVIEWSAAPVSIPIFTTGDGLETASAVDLRLSIVGDSPEPLIHGFSLDETGALFENPQLPFYTPFPRPGMPDPPATEASGAAADFVSPRVIPAAQTLLAIVTIDPSNVDAAGGTWDWLLSNSLLGDTFYTGLDFPGPEDTLLVDGTITVGPHNEWAGPDGGPWTESANWTNNSVPNAVDAVANFLDAVAGPSTVAVDSDVTVGTINFQRDSGYTVGGTNRITLGSLGGTGWINVLQGEHTIAAPLLLAGGLTVDTRDSTRLTLDPAVPTLLAGDLAKVGPGTLMVDISSPLLGSVTVNEGVLQTAEDVLALGGGSSTIYLAADTVLRSSGSVNHRVINTGDPGTSTLEAVGGMEVGNSGASDGYDFQGKLIVGPHFVGLKDADLADLRGATIDGGTISTFNGLHLMPSTPGDTDTILMGTGTVNGNVVAGEEMPEGTPHKRAVIYATDGGKIEITGVMTGAWTPIGNIDITGASRPGFSPEVSLVSGSSTVRTVELEIYGPVGMHNEVPEHADDFNMPVADQANGYDQVLGYASPGESVVTIDGPITLSFPTDYQPTLGDEFVLYFSHAYDPFFGELPGATFEYTDSFLAALPGLLVGLPELADSTWSYTAAL